MPSLPNLQVNTPSHYPQPLAISIDGGKTWIAPYEPLAEGTRFLLGIGFKNSGSAASNVTYQVTLDGELFYSGTKNSVSSGTSWNYNYGTFSLNPGTHELVLTIDPENNIRESDESDNTFSYTITVAGSTDWLVKYYWSQDDPLFGTNVTINAYMPLDPKTGKRCLTGCTNTATALVLSYFASRGYNFTVDLTASDAFTSGGRITIDGTEKNAAANGTLSFAEINELLEEYDPDSPEDVAALCFASGVIAQATFGSSATSTALSNKVILRGGFKSASAAYMYNSDFWTGKKLSDKVWEMLIRNMEKEKPVLASIENPSHAIVVDGYDAQTDKIHLNYGWGSNYTKKYNSSSGVYEGSGWYTRQECDALQFNGFIYDITPDTTAPAAGEITCRKYKEYAELSPSFSDDVEIWKSYYRLGDSGAWEEYTDSVRIDQNCIVYFKACDRAKNYSEESSFVVYGFTGNHESIQPLTITVNAETNGITAGPVTITLDSSGGLGDISYYYKIDSGSWQSCSSQLSVSVNGEVSFYARDIAGNQTETVTCHVGNIDCLAPEVPDGFQVQQSGSGVYIEWEDVTDQGVSGFSHYLFSFLLDFCFVISSNGILISLADFNPYSGIGTILYFFLFFFRKDTACFD